MADNLLLSAATSATIATDEISSVHFQRTKMAWGVDGAAVDASATNPLPVVQTGALPAGTATIGGVNHVASTTGGATPYVLISGASTNSTNVKASAGQVYSIVASNTNAAARYLKLYDKATAASVGTDTPVAVYILSGASTGGGIALNIAVGLNFALGISFALTTGAAHADTGAVASAECVVNLGWK